MNGAFTKALRKVWNKGGFEQNYAHFKRAIASQLPQTQSPNYYVVGEANLAFEAQRPFHL